ncbi:MAG: 2-phospho-L-lactate guanylyltransferase [Gammaproteobacteria bacterium]|nr:MAG: 2-phospho-L-lactate guanylyltransferase [Gammaproteobacteria bacterium]
MIPNPAGRVVSAVWAIVPIKHFELAKARLAPVLEPEQRQALMRAMATDVLTSLAATPGIERILVVSADPAVAALAQAVGAVVLADERGGLNSAVALGAAAAARAGAKGVLVVHGDLPLASASAFAEVISAHGTAPAVTIVPDALEDGSNCLACSPPEIIEFRFGSNSCSAHMTAACERGIEPLKLAIPSLALDVDSPDDLRVLLAAEHAGRSVAFLRSSGIASRLALETAVNPAAEQLPRKLGGSA